MKAPTTLSLTKEELQKLTPREEQILRMHYGIGQQRCYSLKECGYQFAVSKERIRTIIEKCLIRLGKM